MGKLVCTSYSETEYGLILRNNWVEDYSEDKLEKWGIEKYRLSDINQHMSDIMEGRMELPNTVIHVRFLSF